VRFREQFGVRYAPLRGDDREPVAEALRDARVDQLRGAVQRRRILQLGQIVQELRPLLARREVVAREGVQVRGLGLGHRSSSRWRASVARAMMSCWTSLAPS